MLKGEVSVEQKRSNSLVYTSKSMYIFIHYIMWIWICDVMNMFALFNNSRQDTIFINVISVILIVAIIALDFKFFIFEKTDFKCSIGIGILGIIALMYSIYPDTSFDSLAYHVMNQDPVWQGKNGVSFWEAMFPLADRLFYLFRYLLGYKLGTMFNWVLLSLTYIQIVRILKKFCVKKNNIFDKIFNPYLWAFLCISLESVMVDIGTYLTDYTGIPLVLEAVLCLLEVMEVKKTNPFQMIYFVVCLAFLFLMKMTTLIYILPLLIIYVVLNRKQITYKTFFCCFLVGIAIVFPQLLYNYVITERPFYPFYIFSGPKGLASGNGLISGGTNPYDSRWGATSVFEMIFWPVIMLIKPEYRHMEMLKMPNLYPVLLVLCSLVLLVKRMKTKVSNKKCEILVLISDTFLYLWIVSRTVDRYGLASLILCGVVTVCFIYCFWYSKVMIISLAVLFFLQTGCSYYSLMGLRTNFKYPPTIKEVVEDVASYFGDTYYWRNDRGELVSDNEEYRCYFSPFRKINAFAGLINEEARFYDFTVINNLSEDDKNLVYDELYDLTGGEGYTACLSSDMVTVINGLTKYGLRIIDVEILNDTFFSGVNLVVFKSILSEEPNDVLMLSNMEKIEVDVEMENDAEKMLGGWVFVNPAVAWTEDTVSVDFYSMNNDEKVILSHKELVPGEVSYITVDMGAFLGSDLKLYIEVKDNYALDMQSVYIVNMKQIETNSMEWGSGNISFEGSKETSDNPWGTTAGVIEMEEGKCILLTPNTSFSIRQLKDAGKFNFSYEIHPWVRENSDGAGILIWIMDEEDTILHEEVIKVDKEEEWKIFELDLTQYDGASQIKVLCNNGGGNDDGDWVIVKPEE